ncbi:FAD-dependent oxidoreductase [Paenibacillus sp. GYB003]|uniref:FAD-dependent oxidoreductase n=1 Tax=Paenibacillus sp. GYB003 TaxID=2994392 RepID=UPI002F961D6E
MHIQQADVVVMGATPGGIGAALAAARRGRKTVMIERSPFVGGLMTSGLGMTDIHSLNAAGSVFREYASNVLQHYIDTYGADSEQVVHCRNGLRFEPSVGKAIFARMLQAEPNLRTLVSRELVNVRKEGSSVAAVTVRPVGGGEAVEYRASVFIDATYEGDLAAMSGVPYSLGRESRDDWNEEYAGTLYQNFRTKEVLPGSTGEGDDRIQAYNFRLCLTKNRGNQAPFRKPDSYNREDYVSLIEDVREGRVKGFSEVCNTVMIPNGKTDTNNYHYCLCSTDLPEENGEYPEGSWEVRDRIVKRHREYIQGLLWFLQNDEELPEWFREDSRQWGHAADEFEDTDHFPPQIYVREARRIHGEYVFTENDARRAPGLGRSPIHYDSIASGDYGIDSHATRKREPIGQNICLEGFMAIGFLTEIYQIPYGSIVPRLVDGLLVPVAVSATHMGLGTIRMEPCWMQIGYAAGVAADVAIASGRTVREIDIDRLQDELLADKQVITYVNDVPWGSESSKAFQYFGARSFFRGYEGKPDEPVTVAEASEWIAVCRSLPGGSSMPCLPAVANVLPAGVDMGPKSPKEEPTPEQYWAANPLLTPEMARRWNRAAAKSLNAEPVDRFAGEAEFVTRESFLNALYAYLRTARQSRNRPGRRETAGSLNG